MHTISTGSYLVVLPDHVCSLMYLMVLPFARATWSCLCSQTPLRIAPPSSQSRTVLSQTTAVSVLSSHTVYQTTPDLYGNTPYTIRVTAVSTSLPFSQGLREWLLWNALAYIPGQVLLSTTQYTCRRVGWGITSWHTTVTAIHPVLWCSSGLLQSTTTFNGEKNRFRKKFRNLF